MPHNSQEMQYFLQNLDLIFVGGFIHTTQAIRKQNHVG